MLSIVNMCMGMWSCASVTQNIHKNTKKKKEKKTQKIHTWTYHWLHIHTVIVHCVHMLNIRINLKTPLIPHAERIKVSPSYESLHANVDVKNKWQWTILAIIFCIDGALFFSFTMSLSLSLRRSGSALSLFSS